MTLSTTTDNGLPKVKLGLAVESMKVHTTDEGWQIFQGLEHNGYTLCGYNLPVNETDVAKLIARLNPDIVVTQDKREWDLAVKDFREPRARFVNHTALKSHSCYKLTILKDAHQRPDYHKQAAEEMGIDATIIYYDEEIVRQQAPYLGPVIRTYHSLDSKLVPPYEDRSGKAIISGAVSNAYPLRKRLIGDLKYMPGGTVYLPHPGYHRKGCHTPIYLKTLAQYRIAICTCSIYKYALRKLMEATACGCIVITNLPQRYTLPGIDENLVRIDDNISTATIRDLIESLYHSYDRSKQARLAEVAKQTYDYNVVCSNLARDIEQSYCNIKVKGG